MSVEHESVVPRRFLCASVHSALAAHPDSQGPPPSWLLGFAVGLLPVEDPDPRVVALREVLSQAQSTTEPERRGDLVALARSIADQWLSEEPEDTHPEAAPAALSAPVTLAIPGTDDGGDEEEGLAAGRLESSLSDLSLADDVVERLEAAGLVTLYDLLTAPNAVENVISPVHGAGRPLPPGLVAVGGRVRCRVTTCRPDGGRASELLLHGAGPLRVVWHRAFKPVDLLGLAFDGKVVVCGSAVGGDEGSSATFVEDGRLVQASHGVAYDMRYSADADLNDALQESRLAVSEDAALHEDILPERVIRRWRLPSLRVAVPGVAERGRASSADRRRLALDELVLLQLGRSIGRFAVGADRGMAQSVAHRGVSELDRSVGSALSDDQQAALEDIKRDLIGPAPMRRILFGPARARTADVALRAVIHVLEGRSQVLVLCHEPQTALVCHTLWEEPLRELGYQSVLVSGELRRSDRDALRKAEVQVVFATPALLEQAPEWRRLGLVVAFEQAGYGALLALATAMRAPKPDVLVVCRTPVYWDRMLDAWSTSDLTWVDAPEGVPAAGTIWTEDEREQAWARLGEAARAGRRVIIGFPLTRAGTDLLDLRECASLLATLERDVFGDLPIGLFHGAHPVEARRAALADLRNGKLNVLIATTTLELADPLPGDTVVMLEHADRMDLQRLLAWRALVGADGHVHYVTGREPRVWGARAVGLMAERAADETVVAACPEGFPLESAWEGALVKLGWTDTARDRDLVVLARRVAHDLLVADPGLRGPASHRIARIAHGWWSRVAGDTNPIPAPRIAPPRRRRRRRKKKQG